MRNAAKIIALLEARGFSFTFLGQVDVDAHKTFVAKNWPGTVTRSNYEYNRWKYGERADGSINVLLCKKDGAIIGQIGYIPARVSIDGVLYGCVWGCNFKVEEAYRELGIGAALEMYAAQIFPIILGNTPSDDSIKYKRSLGYKILEGPRILMFPVRADHLLKLKRGRVPEVVVQVASAMVNPVLATYNKLRLPANGDSWRVVDEHDIAQRIARKERTIAVPHIVHDERFLKWRCNVPANLRDKAMMFINADDEDSYAVCSVSGKLLNVYDFNFTNNSVFKSFLKQASSVPGISTVRIQANSNNEEALLRKSGFIPFRRKGVITAYAEQRLFEKFDKMYVTGYDGDVDI